MGNKEKNIFHNIYKLYHNLCQEALDAYENEGNVYAVRFKENHIPEDVKAFEKWCMVEKKGSDLKEAALVHMLLDDAQAKEVSLGQPESLYEIVGITNIYTDILGVPSHESDYYDPENGIDVIASQTDLNSEVGQWHLRNISENEQIKEQYIQNLRHNHIEMMNKKDIAEHCYVRSVTRYQNPQYN